MEKLDRTALKQKFQKGRMPSEQDFSNLIDSMVNILEEGFDKTAEDGLKLAQLLGTGKLLSFYENIAVEQPKWFLELSASSTDTCLHFGTPTQPRVMSLRSNESNAAEQEDVIAVGINNPRPETTLDVMGVVAGQGWRGQPGELPVLANGLWQDITDVLTGCEAFEIMAGVGGPDNEGKFAMLHAIAMQAFNGKGHIDYRHAYFGKRCNRIELRWIKVPEQGPFHFKLQMRVKCSYYTESSQKIWIKYFITRLWFDPLMLDSNKAPQ